MSRRHWTDTDRATLRALYPEFSAAECAAAIGCSVSSVNNQVGRLGLRKSREWIARRAAERSTRPDHGGRAHQFRPGHATWNKGKPFNSGGRSVETRFKPGRPPSQARNYQPIGAVRISKDGYLDMSPRQFAERLACKPGFPKPAREGHPRWNVAEVHEWMRARRDERLKGRRAA